TARAHGRVRTDSILLIGGPAAPVIGGAIPHPFIRRIKRRTLEPFPRIVLNGGQCSLLPTPPWGPLPNQRQEDPALKGPFVAVLHAGLLEDMHQMDFHCSRSDGQSLPDLFVL